MNTVSYNSKKKFYKVSELSILLQRGQTAFIGSVGIYENELFLIVYDRVVLARDPTQTWDNAECTIDRFVDVEIVVKN